jgi:N-acetylneuraminic acid mutarotase
MQTPRYRFGAALGSDGRVYAIGGWNGTTALASVEAYNPVSNTWTTVASLPQPEEGLAATTANGLIVVLGGFNGSATYNNFYLYTGARWQTGPAMPTARTDLGVAIGPLGALYAFGGYNNGWLSTVEEFNGHTWSTGQPLPTALASMGFVTLPTTTGRDLLTFGGYNGVASDVVAAFGYFP